MPVNKAVPVSLVDDPDDAMRTEMDDLLMTELMADISANGLTNPIAVEKIGQRYKVIAGHRRLVAHRKLGRESIDVRDYTGEKYDRDALMFGENFKREDISDADAALWLSDLVEKHNADSERLMAITGKSEAWIAQRLALFRGNEQVFNALRKGQINLGTATALNKFPPDYLMQYLDVCINTTPPIRLVNDWLEQVKRMQLAPTEGQPTAEPGAPIAIPPGVVIECCEICVSSELGWTMKYYKIHEHCFRLITQALKAQERG
jgi:ParB/RepB/Spo0J family partition protein